MRTQGKGNLPHFDVAECSDFAECDSCVIWIVAVKQAFGRFTVCVGMLKCSSWWCALASEYLRWILIGLLGITTGDGRLPIAYFSASRTTCCSTSLGRS